jgi:curved DNA-binding protein CbpA
MTETFYDVLGVADDATTDEIETAYRERLKETHPDVSDDDDASRATKRLIEARDVLTDEAERARYDRVGHDAYVAGESDTTGGGSDAAEAARRAGYGGSTSPADRTASTSGSHTGDRARRERDARDRVAEDGRERSGDDADTASDSAGSTGTTDGSATGSDPSSAWTSGATATSGFSDRSDGAGTWSSSSAYAVRQTDTLSRGSFLKVPTGRELTLFAITFALYPVMLFSALLPAFPLWVNVTIGVCTLCMVGYLQSEPSIAILVFGSWSLATTAVLFTLNVSPFSLVGALALSGTWLPFGLSLLTASVLRL